MTKRVRSPKRKLPAMILDAFLERAIMRMHAIGVIDDAGRERLRASPVSADPHVQIGKLMALLDAALWPPSENDKDWLFDNLVERLVERCPLPWRIEQDWTVEVTAKNDHIVMKCMTGGQALFLIAAAERVAAERKAGKKTVAKLLRESARKTRRPRR